jgi:hypothetical protein
LKGISVTGQDYVNFFLQPELLKLHPVNFRVIGPGTVFLVAYRPVEMGMFAAQGHQMGRLERHHGPPSGLIRNSSA